MSEQRADERRRVPEWTFRDRLRKVREDKGFSQQAWADLLGISRGSVSHYELGKETPRRPVLLSWALAGDVDRGWLETGVPSGDGDPGDTLTSSGANRRHATVFRPAFASSVTGVDPLHDLSKAA